jgi:lipopolysaccharide cholinephosphotransferase
MEQDALTKQFQEHILKVFKFTVDFLERHNLRYIACGGTVLGAVRHKNFIPWDDDIDIYLPRADYERLLDLKDEMRKEGFDVLSLRDKGYYLPFAKVSDMNTTLLEQAEFPFVMGIYVDLFALDNFSGTDEEITAIQRRSLKKFYNYQKSVNHSKTCDWWRDALKGHLGDAVEKLQIMLSRPFRKLLLRRFLNYQRWYSSFDGDKTVCVTQWAGRIFKREWFEDVIDYPFADTTVKIPRDYDGYLRCLYGDYMTLPPVEQRHSEHNHLILDFESGVEDVELKA